jgi:uracil-DNA glycosylase
MTPRPALNPLVAAKALAAWWELAGLEPVDIEADVKVAKRALGVQNLEADLGTTGKPAVKSPPLSARAQPNAARKPTDSLAEAIALAKACTSIEALHKAVEAFDGCTLKNHAHHTIFAGGTLGAPVMIIGEAPDRNDDSAGACFSGPAGELLDKMLASIGLDRAHNCYLSCLIPWRPPGDRKATAEEIAICQPFIERHIALAAPKAILFIGGTSAQALLGSGDSVMKLRAKSFSYDAGDSNGTGIYAQCLLSPAYLLNRPSEKALAWKDLLRFAAEISARGVALKV